jgi:hypothetical protein
MRRPKKTSKNSLLYTSFPLKTKKVEGFDLGTRTLNKENRKSRTRTSGKSKMETEYIRTLQDEMKILEYELKLLKDKEIEEKAKMSSIDKFFSDGVPINNNIMALKSMFRKNMSQGNEQVKELTLRAGELEKNNQLLNSQNESIKNEIDQMEEDYDLMEK